MLKCMICGREMKQVNGGHLKTHGVTAEEYKKMFPGAKLIVVSEKHREAARKNIANINSNEELQERNRQRLVKQNKSNRQRKLVSKALKGRTFSEEHKESLKEAKANEDKEHRSKINGDNRRGAKHTPETLLHIARTSNQKHPFRGKSGMREDLGHYVRSTWEANFARILIYINFSYEFEPDTFFLNKPDGSVVTYTPDFKVGKSYVEVKGYWFGDAAEKFELFKQQYPEIKIHLVDKFKYEKYKKYFESRVDWEQ